MDRWMGKVAVVTGASSGIGHDIARGLAEKGIIVVGLARRHERIEELAKTVKGKIHAIKCDVSIEKDIIDAFKWVEDTYGGVDILVNNSGLCKITSLNSGNTEHWKTMIDVNVMGLCICTKEAIKTMRKRGDDGHIIHINSIAGHYVFQYDKFPLGMYTAAKHAVTALTESLRVELRGLDSKIKVTSISPGGVTTEGGIKAIEGVDLSTVSFPDYGETPSMLDCQDVTDAVIYVLGTRPGVQVHELMIQPIGQRLA